MMATDLVLAFTDAAESDSGSLLGLLLPLIIIGGLFYFMLILPQRRRMKAVNQMREGVQVGEDVRTIGGIYGVVTSMEGEDVWLDVGSGTTLRVLKRAIAERLTPNVPEVED
jgi:preprotein translocase subunit YajC